MERAWLGLVRARPIIIVSIAFIVAACSSSATPYPTPAPPQASPTSVSPGSSAPPSAVASAAPSTPASALAATGDVSGTWSGPWKRDPPLGGGGTMTLHLQQSGSNVTGDITAQGSLCITSPGIPLTGTFNDPTLTFTVTGANLEIDYTATVSGTAMTGKLNAVKCPAGVATGTFELKKG